MPNENMGKYVASLGSSQKIPFNQPLHLTRMKMLNILETGKMERTQARHHTISSPTRDVISVEFEDTATRKTSSNQRAQLNKRRDMVF